MRYFGLLLVSALLAACSGTTADPEPGPETSEPWPRPSVLALEEPSSPPLRAPRTKKSAREFAGYLVEQIDYGLRTTFPSAVLRRGTDRFGERCVVCDEVVELAVDARDERRRFELDDWGGHVLATTELPPNNPKDTWTYWRVAIVLQQPEMRLLDDQDGVVSVTPPEERPSVLILAQHDARWVIQAWEFVLQGAAA